MHIAFANTGNRVYSTLKSKGYTDDDILYLSWEPTSSNPNVDYRSTEVNISWGLHTWLRNNLNNGQANDTVVIYFIDHGRSGTWGYCFLPFDHSQNLVSDNDLYAWVNLALTEWDGSINYKAVNIVFDTCYCGLIITIPTTNLTGPNRIVVTATDDFLSAYSWWSPPPEWYINRPVDSNGETIFSYYYLKQILAGWDVQSAFNTSSIQTFNEVIRLAKLTSSGEQQIPQIDNQHSGPLRW
jgi:hypothetical protein